MGFYDQVVPMLTVKDVARVLNIHVNTVRRWSDQNILPSYRITARGDRRFRKEDIEHFMETYNESKCCKVPMSGSMVAVG